MMRGVWSLAVLSGVVVVAGCQRSEEPPRKAVVAINGLLPAVSAEVPLIYVADQKQVKAVERTVSYEPLESFMKANAERKAKQLAPVITLAKPKPPKAVAAKAGKGSPKPAKKNGLFSKLKSGLAGKVMGIAGAVSGGVPVGEGVVTPPTGGRTGKPADAAEEQEEQEEETGAEDDESGEAVDETEDDEGDGDDEAMEEEESDEAGEGDESGDDDAEADQSDEESGEDTPTDGEEESDPKGDDSEEGDDASAEEGDSSDEDSGAEDREEDDGAAEDEGEDDAEESEDPGEDDSSDD